MLFYAVLELSEKKPIPWDKIAVRMGPNEKAGTLRMQFIRLKQKMEKEAGAGAGAGSAGA